MRSLRLGRGGRIEAVDWGGAAEAVAARSGAGSAVAARWAAEGWAVEDC